MPDVEANRRQWDGDYAWPHGGEEWSAGWGGADAQWHFTLLPRLRRWLPASTVLEIAPGHGRWTNYLVQCCERYIGVDLSTQAIEACRQRFADAPHAEFHVNDGVSLAMVTDASVDLAFSFDSLVHAEEDVIAAYLTELARVLTGDGVAFVHHSNLAACRPVARPMRLGLRLAEMTLRRQTPGFDYWRGTTMSAPRFEQLARRRGLACVGQEIVNWLGGRMLDCISVVTPRGSAYERPNVVVHNPYFMAEAASSAIAERVHSSSTAPLDWLADDSRGTQLGALCRIASTSAGPWGISIVGPWFAGRARAALRRRSAIGGRRPGSARP
jgi:SAM-dependent methyltransferase